MVVAVLICLENAPFLPFECTIVHLNRRYKGKNRGQNRGQITKYSVEKLITQ